MVIGMVVEVETEAEAKAKVKAEVEAEGGGTEVAMTTTTTTTMMPLSPESKSVSRSFALNRHPFSFNTPFLFSPPSSIEGLVITLPLSLSLFIPKRTGKR